MIEAESFMLKHDIRKKFKNKEDWAFVGKQDRGASLAKSIYSLVETMCKEEISILYPSDLSI
jgi:pyrimidine operon attenuation protein/uracil phosphoribosyltransferase